MKTSLCSLLEIDKPIVSAPMGGAVGPEFTAAICNAGGFGTIPLWGRPDELVRDGIAGIRARTDKNFAVNLNHDFPLDDALEVCIAEQVFAVSLFWGFDPKTIERAKQGGLVVMSSVGNAEEARNAADAGADVIVAQGWEAGGHVWGRVATMALVPAVVDAVDVPVVAAGGIADGRGMAAALALGASGVWIGTRFLAAEEASIHDTYRGLLLQADESSTEWYADLYDGFWPAAPHRALKNATSEAWHDAGAADPGGRPQEGAVIGEKVTGDPVHRYESHTPGPGTTGDIGAMSLWAGQGVGLVRETAPAAKIFDDIYAEAQATLQRLGQL